MSDKGYRARNLGLAGGLALVAAILTMLYVSRASDASGGTKPAAVATAPVLRATHDLPIGASISAAVANGSVELAHVPAGSLAPGAISNPALLRGVVIQPIYKGEQIVSQRFGPSGTQGFRSGLHGALRALSVPGDANQLLAGTLRNGDHVDVVVNDRSDTAHPRTRVSLRNLVVLQAPDLAESPAAGQTLSATVALTDAQTQTLFWALKNGDWSFVLRPSSGGVVTATKPTTENDVLAGR